MVKFRNIDTKERYVNILKRSYLMLSNKVKIIVKGSIRMLRLGAVTNVTFAK